MGSQCSKASSVDVASKPADNAEKELGPADLCARLQASLPIGTRRRSPFKKFSKCFSSAEAVDWMQQHKQARDRGEAVRKGQTLVDRGLVVQVDGPPEFQDDAKTFYRFTPAAAC
jgi:hypothetical protein